MQKTRLDIEKLYNTFSRKLYFTSLRITADSFDAQEAMQDTFIRLYKLGNTENIERVESWLTSVCIRISIDILRKRNRNEIFKQELQREVAKEDPVAEVPEVTPGQKGELPQKNYSVEAIKGALPLLPDGYRLILSLHLFEGYDYEEIAQITGLQESSIRSQYLRAKKRVVAILSGIK